MLLSSFLVYGGNESGQPDRRLAYWVAQPQGKRDLGLYAILQWGERYELHTLVAQD